MIVYDSVFGQRSPRHYSRNLGLSSGEKDHAGSPYISWNQCFLVSAVPKATPPVYLKLVSVSVTCGLKAFAPSGRADSVQAVQMTVSAFAAAVLAVILATASAATDNSNRRLLQNGKCLVHRVSEQLAPFTSDSDLPLISTSSQCMQMKFYSTQRLKYCRKTMLCAIPLASCKPMLSPTFLMNADHTGNVQRSSCKYLCM